MGTVTEQQTRLMSETQDKLARLGTDIENVRLRFSHGLVPALGGAADKLDEWTYKLLQAEQHHPVATARAGWGTTGLGLGMMGLGGLRVADWLLGSGMHPWLMKTTGSALATAFAGIGGLPVWGTIGIAIAAGFLLYWADKKYGAEIGKGIDKILPAPGSTAGRGAAGFADWLARTFGMPGMPGTGVPPAAPAAAHRPGYKPAGYFEDGGGGVHIAAGAIEININKVPGEDVDKLTDRVMVRLAKMLRDAGMRGAIGSPYGIGGPVMAPGTSV